jgi:hypothetical protein
MASYSETRSAARKFKLDPIEQAFVDAYAANGGDMLAAYDIASPKPELSNRARAQLASMMMRRGKVKRAIAPLHDAAARAVATTLEKYAVTRATIAQALARLAFSDIRDFVVLEHVPRMTSRNTPVLDKDNRPVMQQVLRVRDFAALSPSQSYAICEVHQLESGAIKVKLESKLTALRQLVALMGLAGAGDVSAGDTIEGEKSTGPAPVYLTVTRAASPGLPAASPVLTTARRVVKPGSG